MMSTIRERLVDTESTSTAENRVVFLDNLRYLFVLFVVLQHSASAYFNQARWWSVSEQESSIIAGWLVLFFDAFTMPLLFYIAGYFALPSIRKGVGPFLKGKFKRLGVPWLVCVFTIVPVILLIYHYTRNNLTLPMGYLDLWLILMKNAAQFNVGLIKSMDELMMNNGFYQRYIWFISLLLLFFVLFGVVYKFKKGLFESRVSFPSEAPSALRTLKLLAAVGSLTLIGSLTAFGMILASGKTHDPMAWFTLGNVVQFQPIRLPAFFVYFMLGVITYRNKWIESGKFPGHLKVWVIVFLILMAPYLYVTYVFLSSSNELSHGSLAIHGSVYILIYNFLTISILGLSSALAMQYWNRPNKIDRNLAANSYDIYLTHYLFVFLFQLLLFTLPGIPVLLKFIIVAASSIVCSYMASQFLTRPFPKTTAALLFAMLFVMFVFAKP